LFIFSLSRIAFLGQALAAFFKQAAFSFFISISNGTFVSIKAIEFAKTINANVFLVESAALLHDLNYIIKPNSKPGLAENLRITYLNKSKYNLEDIDLIVKEKGTGK